MLVSLVRQAWRTKKEKRPAGGRPSVSALASKGAKRGQSGMPREVAVYKFAMEQLSEADNAAPYQAISRLKTCPGMDQVLEAVAPVGGHESVS